MSGEHISLRIDIKIDIGFFSGSLATVIINHKD
jgi:hypothetical protein